MAQYKNIDIIPDSTVNRIHLSQGDIGRNLIFYLFENALSWSVPSNSTVKCQGTKPSGFGFSESCTYSGNTVTCVTTEEMTDEYGQIEAELLITSSDESQVFGTSNFILDIEKNPHPASTEDGNAETAIALTARITALESAVGDIDDLETEADDLVGAINEIVSGGSGGSGGSGLTDDIKQALLQIAQKVAYIDDDGQDYYGALYNALYPPANLASISAVYTQSGTVYTTASLNDLKANLVVTAHFDDSTSRTITEYTLSGTLTEGTSTITVSYGGKSTTFTVTVTVFTTAPSIAEYNKGMNRYGNAVSETGLCYTNPYTFDIDIEQLKSISQYDSENNYILGSGYIFKIQYYIKDSNSITVSNNGDKIVQKNGNDTLIVYNTLVKNSLTPAQSVTKKTEYLTTSTIKLIFTLFTADVDDCYAYFDATTTGGVMPVGVSVGDIIFAGANTPYYGMHNISEASS